MIIITHRSIGGRTIPRLIDEAIRKPKCLLNARWSTHPLSLFADLHIHNARSTGRKNAGKQATAIAFYTLRICNLFGCESRKSTRKFFFASCTISCRSLRVQTFRSAPLSSRFIVVLHDIMTARNDYSDICNGYIPPFEFYVDLKLGSLTNECTSAIKR